MAVPGVSSQSIFGLPQPTLPNPDALKQLQRGNQAPAESVYNSDGDDQFVMLRGWVEEGRDRSQLWRDEAEDDLDMVAGHQWDESDIKVLNDDNRPTITFNRSGRNIDLISGMEQQGREEVSYLPREEGDVGVSEVLTSGVQYITDETDANEEKTQAFIDLITTGMGWTNTVMNYRDWDDGMPEEAWINCLEMYWDPHSQRRNLKDSRWRARARTGPTVEFQRMFPNENPATLNASWMGIADDPGNPSEPDRQSYTYENSPTQGRPPMLERSTVIEIQWWEVAKKVIAEDLFTAQRTEIDAGRFGVIKRQFPGRYISVPVERKEYYRAFLGGKLLKKTKLEGLKDFTFQPMTGKRDRRTGWYGLVRAMRDPQRWANKWLSQSMHILNTGAKNTVLYETGSLMDGRRAQENWTKPGAWIEVARGAIASQRIQVQAPTPLPPDLTNMMHFALQSVQDCVGINQEMLGTTGGTDANRAALLEQERRKAGLTLMAGFFDSKRLFVKRQGRLLLSYMMMYMNDGRLIRVVNEGTKKYARLLLEGSQKDLEYDVIVDESPDAPNQKEKTWETIVALLPMLERLQPPTGIWTKILRYSPLPVALVNSVEEEIKKAEQKEQDDGGQGELVQAQVQKLMADAQRAAAQAQKSMAEIEKIRAQVGETMANTGYKAAQANDLGARFELDTLEAIRETQAMDDAREVGKLTVHENA